MLFPLSARVLCLAHSEAFVKLFDNSSYHFAHALLVVRCFREVDWSEASFVRWFLYSFGNGTVQLVEAFTVLSRTRGTDGELLPSETLSKILVTWLSESCFCYADEVSAVVRHCGEDSSPLAIDPGVPSSSPHYYAVSGKADWDLASFNAANEPLHDTVLKKTFTGLREAFPADVTVPSSILNVADFDLARVTATVASNVSSNDPLRHTAEVSELQNTYDRLVAQCSSVTSECDTWLLLAQERCTETRDL